MRDTFRQVLIMGSRLSFGLVCWLVGVLVVVWVQQRPRHFGRGLLAGVPALGFGWLAAWFAGHR
jgi:hypothetical protein